MVVGIDNWKSIRTSLMKDVHGFPINALSCHSQALRRTNSLNSIQSLCSTNFSSDEDLSSEYLNGLRLPTVPSEDEDEDWRMFGWLLDSAEASCSMNDASPENLKARPFTPLPPLEIPIESSLPEASDLLKIKRHPRCRKIIRPGIMNDKGYTAFNQYRDPQSRKRSSFSSDEDSETDEEDMFEYRPMTRAMAHYLELKRRRKIGAPMPEEMIEVKHEIEANETYYYQDPSLKEEYSMDIETPNSTQNYSEPVDIKPDILSKPKSKKTPSIVVKAEVLPGVKTADGKRTKPGRPTNKDKRQQAKKAATELKKQKKDIAYYKDNYGIDINDPVCFCRAEFDASRTYLRCMTCRGWFHCKCVGISESRAEAGKIKQWHCVSCAPADGHTIAEEDDDNDIYNDETVEGPQYVCICNTLFDSQSHYIGCNICTNWFHPHCINRTVEEVNESQHYICPNCEGSEEHFTPDEFQQEVVNPEQQQEEDDEDDEECEVEN